MINLILALLVEKEVLAEEEAQFLAQKLSQAIQPSNFLDAQRTIENILKEYKISK